MLKSLIKKLINILSLRYYVTVLSGYHQHNENFQNYNIQNCDALLDIFHIMMLILQIIIHNMDYVDGVSMMRSSYLLTFSSPD